MHVVGSFSHMYSTMHGSENIKFIYFLVCCVWQHATEHLTLLEELGLQCFERRAKKNF